MLGRRSRSSRKARRVRRPSGYLVTGLMVGVTALGGAAAATAAPAAPSEPDLPLAECPSSLPSGTTCYSGRQESGSYYWIAVPAGWNGNLVVHAHGGPSLGAAGPERSLGDLDRWSVMVDEGFAWAGTSYRRGGYGAQMAATDTEQLRRLFVDAFGAPDATLLHGQSWGGNVAAKTLEMFGKKGSAAYDGALFTNGVLAGGSRSYDFRLDLRVVYQHYCGNHPRPDEAQYELWRGLPPGATMTTAELTRRVHECTGIQSSPEERTAEQRRNLANILSVIRIPERTLVSHLRFATRTFQDIVHERLDDQNPFSNLGVRYEGSDDDRALNRGVLRYEADQEARRDLSFDSDLTGDVSVPILTLHAIDDPTIFVEHDSAYRSTLEAVGNDDHLVQSFTRESEHSSLSDSEYATTINALLGWATGGERPSASSLADACGEYDATYGEGCFFDPSFQPRPFFERVHPRPGNTRWPALTERQYERWEDAGDVGIDY